MAAIPDYTALTADISKHLKPLRQDLPAVMKAFGELSKAASTPGALDEKTKEFVALGIAISTRCDGCIGFQVRTLVTPGTPTEAFE